MAKVIKLESRRVKHEHDRKDAKAKAMQDAFRAVRIEQEKSQEGQQQATNKLLAIFKTKAPRKPSPPTRRK
jgi:hypothetical protein